MSSPLKRLLNVTILSTVIKHNPRFLIGIRFKFGEFKGIVHLKQICVFHRSPFRLFWLELPVALASRCSGIKNSKTPFSQRNYFLFTVHIRQLETACRCSVQKRGSPLVFTSCRAVCREHKVFITGRCSSPSALWISLQFHYF